MTAGVVIFPPVPSGAQTLVIPNSVTMRQFKGALTAAGAMVTVSNTISSDINDSVGLQWTSGMICVIGDGLYVATQNALSYTASQMTNLMTSAAALPY